MGWKFIDIETLIGKTIKSLVINAGMDEVSFGTDDKKQWIMHHNDLSCEVVELHKVNGDITDLFGSKIVFASTITESDSFPSDIIKKPEHLDSWTVTVIRLATENGGVDFIWLGQSNGYYGEGVDIEEVG